MIFRSFPTFLALLFAVSSAAAANIGVQVNGNCAAGSCPPQLLSFGSNASLPVSTSVTLSNGDIYGVTGTITSSSSADGQTLNLSFALIAVYQGNGASAASQDDTLRLDIFTAYQSTFSTGNFAAALTGTFSPNVAGSSSVEVCVDGACAGPVSPPGPFNQSVSFSQTASNGGFSFDDAYTAHFGAGSPVGAYIVFNYPALSSPVIASVISASGYGAFPAIAPGSWIEIYGSNLALGQRIWEGSDFMGTAAPQALGGTTVTVGGQAAFVEYVSTGQVNVQVPSNVATSPQPLILTTPAGASAVYTATVSATEPGLLAPALFLIGGTQYAEALFSDETTYVLPPGAIPGLTSRRAKPGDTIILYGVGFGPVTPDTPAGQIAQGQTKLVSSVDFSIGGSPVTPLYAGLAPQYVGLYQFNVTVPTVAASDKVPVTFTQGGSNGAQTLYIVVGN